MASGKRAGTRVGSRVTKAKTNTGAKAKTKAGVKAKAKMEPAPPKRTKSKSKSARATKRRKRREERVDGDMLVCGAHGETRATFVCRHLSGGTACGFHAAPPTPDNPWPDAWCDQCDEAFQAGGGEWNEKNEGRIEITLLCTFCYDAARDRNVAIPHLARGAIAQHSDAEAAELFHHALHAAQALQDESNKKWRWQKLPRWDLHADERTLTFSDPKRPSIVADVRFVGSYSTKTGTFQWAWETLGDKSPEARELGHLRVFGEVRGLDELTTPNWACDEADGWRMTSLAAYLLGADAVYRAPSNHLFWFMLLSNLRHVH